jgi:sialic acid synthase SpsE
MTFYRDTPYIIAEVGGNHGGDVETAEHYIKAAAKAGADAVKFQFYRAETLIIESEPPLPLAGENYDSQFERFKELELTVNEWRRLVEIANKHNVDFAASVFDPEIAEFVAEVSPFIKIASGDLTNTPLLRRVNELGEPVVLSTGFATREEIADAVEVLADVDLTLLHCVGSYPTPDEQAHLEVMDTLTKEFDVPVGYSDHTVGTRAPIAAIARGACIIEKHFTLDKNIPVGDHRLSATPSELATIVDEGHKIRSMVGQWTRDLYLPVEKELRTQMRRSLATTERIEAGEHLREHHVTALRPATGIPPTQIDNVIGATVATSIEPNTILTDDHIEEL